MLTNYSDIRLPLAVWLASDDYDYDPRPNAISATGLMRPIKSIVLGRQIAAQLAQDLVDLIPARMGTALHDAIEKSWTSLRLNEALERLEIPAGVREKIRINPPRENLDETKINIWLEQRAEMVIDEFIITGKFDLVFDYTVEDNKSTGTYNNISGTNNDKYALQGSIYRLLNQDIIRKDYMFINFIFTDWSALKARADKSYPQSRLKSINLPLMSLPDTEHYIRTRLALIRQYMNKPQPELPACTPEELWQKPTTYAYYKNPKSLNRATKVSENQSEVMQRLIDDGSVGIIVPRPGAVNRCRYCPARPICKQAEGYVAEGLLDV